MKFFRENGVCDSGGNSLIPATTPSNSGYPNVSLDYCVLAVLIWVQLGKVLYLFRNVNEMEDVIVKFITVHNFNSFVDIKRVNLISNDPENGKKILKLII